MPTQAMSMMKKAVVPTVISASNSSLVVIGISFASGNSLKMVVAGSVRHPVQVSLSPHRAVGGPIAWQSAFPGLQLTTFETCIGNIGLVKGLSSFSFLLEWKEAGEGAFKTKVCIHQEVSFGSFLLWVFSQEENCSSLVKVSFS